MLGEDVHSPGVTPNEVFTASHYHLNSRRECPCGDIYNSILQPQQPAINTVVTRWLLQLTASSTVLSLFITRYLSRICSPPWDKYWIYITRNQTIQGRIYCLYYKMGHPFSFPSLPPPSNAFCALSAWKPSFLGTKSSICTITLF